MLENKSINSKEILAKLMSTENIQIRHKKVNTAMFDVKNRILYLPIWKDMDDNLYTLFITHEVGHALHTPFKETEEALKKEPKLGMIINIVEDARIDKKMKVRFPGVKTCYQHGTKTLLDMDFFGLKKNNKKVEDLRFLDRINIHYKEAIYGHIPPIQFSEEELPFIKEIDEAITFKQVVDISERLLKYIRDKKKEEVESLTQNEQKIPGKGKRGNKEGKSGKGGSNKVKSNSGEQIPQSSHPDPYADDEDSESEEDCEEGASETERSEDPIDEDLNAETMDSATQNMLNLNDKNATEICYCNFPKLNTKSFIVPYKEVHRQLDNHYAAGDWILNAKCDYETFRRKNQKVVDYLVKEFELKKAAAITSKTKIANTGSLDSKKLFSFRYNEDLFKKIADIPEGKNHGLIMFVDCSGSMSSNMLGTLQQIINLVSFCRKIGIPYDVYGFTDNMQGINEYMNKVSEDKISSMLHKNNPLQDDIVIDGKFNLRHYFSSRMKSIEHMTAMTNMMALVNGYKNKGGGIPSQERLQSTPFDETIIIASQLVKEMKCHNQLDIVHTIFLTDGYGTSGIQYADANGRTTSTQGNVIVRSKNRDYDLNNKYDGDSTRMFLEILKRETDVNVVGFYICNDYQIDSAINRMTQDSTVQAKFRTDFEKQGFLAINEAGWDEYYIIPDGVNIEVNDSEFAEVQKESNLQEKFSNALKRQQTNRVILRKFINKIAKKKELTK